MSASSQYFHLNTIQLVTGALYILLFLPALFLNVTAVWISMHLHSKSTFIVYLKNLVAADLLMTMTLPIRAASELPGASLGLRAFSCRFNSVVFYLCFYISIILMGLISLDRFFKIVRPWGKVLGQSILFARLVTALIWALMLSFNIIPTMVLTNQEPSNISTELCMGMKNPAGAQHHKNMVEAQTILFWTVSVVVALSYSCIAKKVFESYQKSGSSNVKGRRKTNSRVFVVLVVFLVCFAPYHIIRIPYTAVQVKNKTNCTWAALKAAKEISLCLSSTNICLDPLIYFFLCKTFRKKLSEFSFLPKYTSSSSSKDDPVTESRL
uniref:G-protein coupled receptors family 1 profile domain-containing protein n=1 Tax=Denticeps clupeoides TaxID=299321 RepID=A0AAY4DHP5_9TELE